MERKKLLTNGRWKPVVFLLLLLLLLRDKHRKKEKKKKIIKWEDDLKWWKVQGHINEV